MARLYTNENIALQLVLELRSLGHDVLTSYEAGNANRSIDDADVLTFAIAESRILVTYNRLHFLRIHKHRQAPHAGIVLCSVDFDYAGQARQIHETISAALEDQLVRVNKP